MLTRRLVAPSVAGALVCCLAVVAASPVAAAPLGPAGFPRAGALQRAGTGLRAAGRARDAAPRAGASLDAASGFGAGSGRQVLRDLRSAWQITRGSGVTIALIGGNVDRGVPGLAGQVTRGPGFGPAARPLASVTAFSTVFASVVAGSGPDRGNPTGTLGLAPAARILAVPVRPLRHGSSWRTADAAAIRYSASHGARVIVAEWSGFQDGKALESAVSDALARGAVVIGLEWAPRSELKVPEYPDASPGVIGAACATLPGMTAGTRVPALANESILVSAPANVLIGSGPRGLGYRLSGAPSAAAWLTATVALIKSVYPRLSPALVARALAVSARDHPRGGYTTKEGFGLIDPIGALRAAASLRKLRTSAAAGPAVVAPAARVEPGAAPGVIDAAPRSTAVVVGSAAAAVVGLLLLILAVLLSLTWRRRRRAPPPPPPAPQQ